MKALTVPLACRAHSGLGPGIARSARSRLREFPISHPTPLRQTREGHAAALRARHPDRSRTVIVRVTIRPSMRNGDRQRYSLTGHISQIAIAGVNVPHARRPVLETQRNAPRRESDPPRYEVQLAIGQRLEPSVERVTALRA